MGFFGGDPDSTPEQQATDRFKEFTAYRNAGFTEEQAFRLTLEPVCAMWNGLGQEIARSQV